MDFSCAKYSDLLDAFHEVNFNSVLRFEESQYRQTILRHDVDQKPLNSLRIAELEFEKGCQSIFYFRAVPESWDVDVIRKIAAMGHEIGYHYESLTTCNGDMDNAYNDFRENLNRLSEIIGTQVRSICMHGSPRSPFDSRDLWKKYSYRELGVNLEPYFDTDFSKVLYLTDTGRRWDGFKVSVRDRIPVYQDQWISQGLIFHSTDDIIRWLKSGPSVKKIMITTHPQRWENVGYGWFRELVLQNVKNVVKRGVIAFRENKKL